MNRKFFVLLTILLLLPLSIYAIEFNRYHQPPELVKILKDISREYDDISQLHVLATSPGNNEVVVLEIGPETGKSQKSMPAVLVVANVDGTVPLASEASLYLIEEILKDASVRKDKSWYIIPCINPDAVLKYFQTPLYLSTGNGRKHNDDQDDQTDEDGPDDLDGDGIITQMRVEDPDGEWIEVKSDPRVLKKADNAKGERGIYKLYTEGIDNDGDGKYNEDGPGGVNISINFPHLFEFFTKSGGPWAGSEDESYNLMRFIFEHPDIGITFVFGKTNFCLVPPKGGRKGEVDFDKIKVPERAARWLNLDIEKTYTMKELMEKAQAFAPPGREITESRLVAILGLGQVVNPLAKDLKFYKELSEKYKAYLKENKVDIERLDPAAAEDGSFELWSYYQLGLPSFSMDFWTLPKVKEKKRKDDEELSPDKIGNMSNEEFLSLGEEKVDKLLKSSGAPPRMTAKNLIQLIQNGTMTTKRMAEMLKRMPKPEGKEEIRAKDKALLAFSDSLLNGKGFVAWHAYDHPTLGKVELGGSVPFTETTPPSEMITKLLSGQVPWVFRITEQMARIKIGKTEVTALGGNVYRIKVWIDNQGYLPYPTAMGSRNNRIPPVVVTLEGKGINIIEGKKRSLIKAIDGNQSKSVSWLVHSEGAVKVTIKANTRIAWHDSIELALGGK